MKKMNSILLVLALTVSIGVGFASNVTTEKVANDDVGVFEGNEFDNLFAEAQISFENDFTIVNHGLDYVEVMEVTPMVVMEVNAGVKGYVLYLKDCNYDNIDIGLSTSKIRLEYICYNHFKGYEGVGNDVRYLSNILDKEVNRIEKKWVFMA